MTSFASNRRAKHGAIRLDVAFRYATRIALAALVGSAFTACLAEPMSIHATANPQIEVSLLFEHDGCRVYRFSDGARPVYYTDCRGSTAWQVSCGRNCTMPVMVSTAR